MRNLVRLAVLPLLLTGGTSERCARCGCDGPVPPPLDSAVAAATRIFVGTVVGVDSMSVTFSFEPTAGRRPWQGHRLKLVVSRSFKGGDVDSVTVVGWSNCSWFWPSRDVPAQFVGQAFLVYATLEAGFEGVSIDGHSLVAESDSLLMVSACGRTARIVEAAEDVAWFEAGR